MIDNDLALVKQESSKLRKEIKHLKLYRKGHFLYDVQKLRPMYSIAEYAWTFCTNPFLADRISESLEHELPDIPDSSDMNLGQICDLVTAYWYAFVEGNRENKITPQMCKFLYFFCQKNVIEKYAHSGVTDILDQLDARGWEPAKYFLKKISNYSTEIIK